MKTTIKRILVPLDFSPTSLEAINFAKPLAKLTGAEIFLLHVRENIYATTDPFFSGNLAVGDYEDVLVNLSTNNLNKALELFQDDPSIKVNVMSTMGRTHTEIVRISLEEHFDIIIMGTHGVSGFREFVAGSNTYKVVSDAKIPVLSVQEKNQAYNFKKILVPFTDMPHSRENVIYAIKFAEIYTSELIVLGINDGESEQNRKLQLEAKQIEKMVDKHNLRCTINIINANFKADVVLNQVKKTNSDLIVVIGDMDKQNFAEYFSGSFSQQIINHSTIPVLSIHSKYNPEMIELWSGI
jgi:nucleotide-binding universal stress UspA family protein